MKGGKLLKLKGGAWSGIGGSIGMPISCGGKLTKGGRVLIRGCCSGASAARFVDNVGMT